MWSPNELYWIIEFIGPYRPENTVPGPRDNGSFRYCDIARTPSDEEMRETYRTARSAWLWRFDERRQFVRMFDA